MKKLTLALLTLLSCGSVLANQSPMLINTDADSVKMKVTYKVCNNPSSSERKCEKEQEVTLRGKNWAGSENTFVRIPIPDDKIIVVTSVWNWFSHRVPQEVTASFSEKTMDCSAADSDAITLDTLGTDTVICNNHNTAGIINGHS